MKKDNPRCQALDMNGKQCRKKSVDAFQYHGSHGLYWGYEKNPQWVKVNLCEDHKV